MRLRRGSAAMEFALTLPILLALVGGVIDYGLALHQLVELEEVCREGARAGSQATANQEPTTVATQVAQALLSERPLIGQGARVTATYEGASPMELLVVTIRAPSSRPFGIVPGPDEVETYAAWRLQVQD